MIAYPDIDPVALRLGPVSIHWYGVMYLVGFGAGWWLGRIRARDAWRGFRGVDVDDLLFYVAVGIILGGRLGYVLFYAFDAFVRDPLSAVRVWDGGMSFHGGLIGVMVAVVLFARRSGRSFFTVADFVVPLVPPGLAAGRLGNFINGNLWGGPSDLPWAMVFPDPRAGAIPRHPSQLYEALLEGAVLFAILWYFSRRPRPAMAVSGLFLLCYGLARFAIEFVRVPDAHIGYLAGGWFTQGQLLTAPMILFGAVLLAVAARRGVVQEDVPEPSGSKRARQEAGTGRRRKRRG